MPKKDSPAISARNQQDTGSRRGRTVHSQLLFHAVRLVLAESRPTARHRRSGLQYH